MKRTVAPQASGGERAGHASSAGGSSGVGSQDVDLRGAFLLEPAVTFLNHGSYGACPREVLDAVHAWQIEVERNPVEALSRRAAGLLKAARTLLASYLGAQAEHLVFVPNATTGVGIVAQSLQLRPGDEVLCTDQEYGACEAALRLACLERGVVLRRVEIALPFDAARFAGQLMAAVGPRTRLILCSHIVSTTALIFPVADLCRLARAAGVHTLIDGAHAPGQIDVALDAIGADYYTGNCHKWMCGPKGSAFLHVRPEHHTGLRAPVVSWGQVAGDTGGSPYDGYTGRSLIERRLQWQGTRDLASYLAVPAAIEFQRRNDWHAVRARCHAIAIEALHRVARRYELAPLGTDADHAQMVALPVPHQDAETLRRKLFETHRIEVPVTQHAGRTFVRLSVQGYNTADDVERLCAVLEGSHRGA